MSNLSPFKNEITRNTVPSNINNIGMDDSADRESNAGKLTEAAPAFDKIYGELNINRLQPQFIPPLKSVGFLAARW